ncbi:glycosyltransferase [uncultured Sphingomonas sp.]|uniref:glycosyltransferase n=1 Tax=uncultured Sphingomonas sp. TaxID=158754 RepID=UPI0035CAB2E7
MISDQYEQPRVVYDAFARGLLVLVSATTDNRQIITHGRNGPLYEPNNAEALAAVLVEAAAIRLGCTEWGDGAGRQVDPNAYGHACDLGPDDPRKARPKRARLLRSRRSVGRYGSAMIAAGRRSRRPLAGERYSANSR